MTHIPHKYRVDGGCCDDGVHPDARGAADRMFGLFLVVAVWAAIAALFVAAYCAGRYVS